MCLTELSAAERQTRHSPLFHLKDTPARPATTQLAQGGSCSSQWPSLLPFPPSEKAISRDIYISLSLFLLLTSAAPLRISSHRLGLSQLDDEHLPSFFPPSTFNLHHHHHHLQHHHHHLLPSPTIIITTTILNPPQQSTRAPFIRAIPCLTWLNSHLLRT